MTARRRKQLVVVDGSNLATEGRAAPSLKQLDESVTAFREEHPDKEVVVVVDATFGHRVAPAERERVKQAELAGEIVTPPAGAVGRGDAFILKIAKRANAAVLSNDSFQEFHAEHPWLFEEGRLIGGKPVARVGWIFTPRIPVRAQGSRTQGSRSHDSSSKASKAAGQTKATAKATTAAAPAARTAAQKRATKAAQAEPTVARRETARSTRTKQSSVAIKAVSRAHAVKAQPVKAQPVKAQPVKAQPVKATTTRKQRAAPADGKPKTASTTAKAAAAKEPAAKRAPDPVNTVRSFQRLVTDVKVGGKVEGEVVQFTSHGAMVAVRVGRTMKVVCYAPLAGLGSPAPTRARDVLKKGESYRFAIVAFDATRRRAELALAR